MSRSVLRKEKNNKQEEMEGESKTEEPFLKIGTIWSESEPDFSSITIKEENISDVELENTNESITNNIEPLRFKPEGDIPKNNSNSKGATNEVGKSKNSESGEHNNVVCLHDSKSFKVKRKRLICSNCHSVMCPECFTTVNSLQSHFSKSDNNNKSLYPCKLCSMIFKSNCALQAHVRIHLLDTPYVCPDCGLVYNNMYLLSLHLINTCYHVYKVITNGCKFCLNKNMPPEEFVAHIKRSHLHLMYKCSVCGSVFSTSSEITRHFGTNHKNENALCLGCFSCSMCEGDIIEEKLYEQHIKYHVEHTVAFQIGYLCSCGHGFRTASTFRSHFRGCNKRGILPPQWTYLQVTLKTHEMSRVQKNAFRESEPPLMSTSSELRNGSDPRRLGFNLYQDSNSSEDLDEPVEGTPWNHTKLSDENKAKTNEVRGTVISKTRKQVNKNPPGKSDKSISESSKSVGDGQKKGTTDSTAEVSNEKPLDNSQVCDNLNLGGNVHVYGDGEVLDESVIGHIEIPNDSSDKGLDQSLKVVYDHIPCDHLGYLKSQQSSDMRVDVSEGINFEHGESVTPSERHILTSVLDEKTGLMRTKEVVITQSQDRNENGPHTGNSLSPQKFGVQCLQIERPSAVSTVFSCPFCPVLFPKHFSTFQRFRLHLEFYHPDASLDITVDRSQIPKSQTKYTTISMRADSEDELDDIDLQTRLDLSLKEARHTTSRLSCLDASQSDKGSLTDKQSKVGKAGSENQIQRRDIKKNACSRKLSEINSTITKLNPLTVDGNELKDQNIFLVNLECNEELDEESLDSENGSNKTVKSKKSDDGDKSKKSPFRRRLSDGSKYQRTSEDSLSDDCYFDRVQRVNSDQVSLSSKNYWLRKGSDNFEGDQEGDFEKSESVKDDLTPRSRSTERRASRRESDVWSEFYKTLKIAETFKKTKMKHRESNGGEEASILTNYANKRVVKKPKRYRESSDSDVSNDDGKQSPGDSRHFDSRIEPDEDDVYIKKKRLMNRLENMDYRLLEYMFKVLERKQKNYSVLKKGVDGLKGYKKKVVNGIKSTGRQRPSTEHCDEVEAIVNPPERDLSDFNYDEMESESLPNDEKLERKRGRPKKGDSLKERRRSDLVRELGFAEKMSDADESVDYFTGRKKRKFSKVQCLKKVNAEKNDFSSGQVITTKDSETEKKLTCAVCKLCYQTEAEFREHIQVHKDDDNNHQCLECGECFVVRPSLEKHLHAFHKIKDVQKYIDGNDIRPADKNEEEEEEPLKENQCKVCRDQFDNTHDLNKHFRIHGMAFLRQYRKDNKSN